MHEHKQAYKNFLSFLKPKTKRDKNTTIQNAHGLQIIKTVKKSSKKYNYSLSSLLMPFFNHCIRLNACCLSPVDVLIVFNRHIPFTYCMICGLTQICMLIKSKKYLYSHGNYISGRLRMRDPIMSQLDTH